MPLLRCCGQGDAAGAVLYMTPVASPDADVVPAYRPQGPARAPDDGGGPSGASSVRPIAAVWASEGGGRRGGLKVRVNAASTPGWLTARRRAEPVYGHK